MSILEKVIKHNQILFKFSFFFLEIFFVQKIQIQMNHLLVLFVNVMKLKYQNLGKLNLKIITKKLIHFQNLFNLGKMNKKIYGFQNKMNQVIESQKKYVKFLLSNRINLCKFIIKSRRVKNKK